MRNMIAYCGLDCETCDAYLATINDDQALREKTAKLWAELKCVVTIRNSPVLCIEIRECIWIVRYVWKRE